MGDAAVLLQLLRAARLAMAREVGRRGAQHGAADREAARDHSFEAMQRAQVAQTAYDTHRDLVTQEAERDDNLILVELRRAGTDLSLKDAQAFLSAASPQLVGGTLPGRRVAVVLLGQTDASIVDAITSQLKAAGASISAQVQVTDAWTSSAKPAFPLASWAR